MGTKPGTRATLSLEKMQKGIAFFKAQSELDLAAALEAVSLPGTLPNPEAARTMMKGLSGRQMVSAELAYSLKDGMPHEGKGKAEGYVSFKQSPEAAAINLDFVIRWARSRLSLTKPLRVTP